MLKQIFCLLLLTSNFIYAQGLSMDDAVELAKANNRMLQNAGKEIKIAQQKRLETIADGLPQVSASASYLNSPDQPVSVVPSQFFGGTSGTYTSFSFGLSQSASAGLSLEQMIFDGSYLVGLQASKVYLQISEQAYIKSEQEVVGTTVESYLNTLLATAQLKVLQNNLQVAENNFSDITQLYNNGLTEEENVDQLSLDVTSLKSAVRYTENLVLITKNMLQYVLGVEYDEPLELASNLEELTIRAQSQILGNLSIASNIDFQIAQNDIKSKELLFKLESFKALPRVSAFANSGYDGFNESFDFFNADQKWYSRTTLGLSINFPVFTSFQGRSKKKQAKLEIEKSKKLSADLAEALKLQEKSLKNEVNYNLINLKTTTESLALAKSIEKKNQIKFKEGMVSTYILRQAQTQLYQAQNNYLNAMHQLVLSKAKLTLLLQPITN